jgi:uncharacterized protein
MKLQPDKFDVQAIAASGPGWVDVATQDGGKRFQTPVAIGSRGELFDWPVAAFDQLAPEHFGQLAALKPELVVFGSGVKLRFVHPKLQTALMQARIGLECMDTLAACRTYNILAQEGRHVVVALLFDGFTPSK